MKVLQIIDSLPIGGGARFVVNFVLALNQKGIETDILLLDGTETDFYKELKEKNTCKIITLPKETDGILIIFSKLFHFLRNIIWFMYTFSQLRILLLWLNFLAVQKRQLFLQSIILKTEEQLIFYLDLLKNLFILNLIR